MADVARTKRSRPGQPPVIDEYRLQLLTEAFGYGATDEEACFYADIAPATLYNYQKKHPKFLERKTRLKERPIMVARKSVVDAMRNDGQLALKFLERKRKDEFSTRNELTGADGQNITFVVRRDNENA